MLPVRLPVVAILAALLFPSGALGAVEILSRGVLPTPPVAGQRAVLTVDVRVDQAPFTAEFTGPDGAQRLAIPATDPRVPATAARLQYPFTAGAGDQITVTVTDAAGGEATQAVSVTGAVRATPPEPTGPTALAECQAVVDLGLAEVRTQGGGCWRRNRAGTAALTRGGVPIAPGQFFFETSDRFALNGIPFPAAPAGSNYVLTEPGPGSPGGRLGIDRAVIVRLGPLTVLNRSFLFNLPAGAGGGARLEGALPAFTIPAGSLGGLPVGGSVSVVLRREGTRHSAVFPVQVTLPAVFTPSPGVGGRVTGTTQITTDETRGVSLEGGRIGVTDVAIGTLQVQRLCFSFLPGGVSSRFAACEVPSLNGAPILTCRPTNPRLDRFDGSITAILPTRSRPRLGAFAGLAGGSFQYAGGFFDDAAIPLVQGINLERLGFAVCVNPLTVRGDAGVSVGGGFVRGDVSVLYAETRNRGFFIEVSGNLRIATIPIGSGRVKLSSTGAVEFAAQASINLANGFFTVDGRIAGIIVPNPRFRFQVEGAVEACIANRFICAGAEGVVSNKGVSGCATLGLIKYSGFFPFGGGAREDGFGCGFADRARIFNLQAVVGGGPAPSVQFTVPPNSPQYVAHIKGISGAPKVVVTSPSGRTFSAGAGEASSDQQTFLITENAAASETSIFLAREATPGLWTVTAQAGSVPLSGDVQFQEAEDQPTTVTGTVADDSGTKIVSLRYALSPGQTVAVDVVGDEYQQTIAEGLSGSPCTDGPTIPGRTAAQTRCQTITFKPTFGYEGRRTIRATVYDETERVIDTADIATYTATEPPLPTTPPNVRLVRRGGDVIAVWGRSTRGVTRYGAHAVLSDGRKLGFTTGPNCLAWRIPRVARGTRVKLRVLAGRQDLEFGGTGTAALAPRAAFGGPKRLRTARTPRPCAALS